MNQLYPPLRRPRTSEDFYLFCKIILEHENYEMIRQQEEMRKSSKSPMDSAGSTKSDSTETSSVPDDYKSGNLDDSDDVDTDSYNLITCYCGKPYAKRPMIECSNCLTWLHLKCVKVRRNNIPEVFYCYKCQIINNSTTNVINQHDDNTNSIIQQHQQKLQHQQMRQHEIEKHQIIIKKQHLKNEQQQLQHQKQQNQQFKQLQQLQLEQQKIFNNFNFNHNQFNEENKITIRHQQPQPIITFQTMDDDDDDDDNDYDGDNIDYSNVTTAATIPTTSTTTDRSKKRTSL